MNEKFFERFHKLTSIMAKKSELFPYVVVFMFEVLECVLQLGTCSQNKGSRCTLPYNNEHFDSKKD